MSDNPTGSFILTSDPEDIEVLRLMAFDPSVGDWLAQTAPTKLAKPFKTDAGEIITEIPIGHFGLMAARLSQYKKRPWTKDDTAELKKLGLEQARDRRMRHNAAQLLREEARPWRDYPSMAEHVRRWDEAIAVLCMPRGVQDSPHNWLHFAANGDAMEPWSYMATEIASFLVQILRGYEQPLPTFGPKSSIVVFTDQALRFIGVNDMPSLKTLGDKLRETLAPMLKDWPVR